MEQKNPILETTQEELAGFLRAESAPSRWKDWPDGCCYMRVGTADGIPWCVVMALSGEAGEKPEVRAKLARNVDDLQCDYDWDWEMPVNEDTSEVLDSDIPVAPGSADSDAAWFLSCLRAIPGFMAPRAAEGGSL